MTRTLAASALAAGIVWLGGCAGGDGGGAAGGDVLGGDRPDADSIAAAIQNGQSGLGVAPTQADCAARLVVDSGMSDEAIGRYVGEGGPGYVDPDDYSFTQADRVAFDELLVALDSECGVQQAAG